MRFPTLRCITRTYVPPNFRSCDILVLPASLTPSNEELITHGRVIAYGPVEFMPEAFLRGCIDYLVEPWCPEELFYRALRIQMPQRMSINHIEVLVLPGGIQTADRIVHLTAVESSLLSALIKAKGAIVPRSILEQLIPGPCSATPTRKVDAHMARLRKKILRCLSSYIEDHPSSVSSPLKSARVAGYYLITD